MSRSDVTILGCGPAGLLAAHAAALRGHNVNIISKKQKSPLGGAQYMHFPIPDLDVEKSIIRVIKYGDSRGYAKKVYGYPTAKVSWDERYRFTSYVEAWDIIDAYNKLWDLYQDQIQDMEVDRSYLMYLLSLPNNRVISTIPKKALCNDHKFTKQEIWVDPVFMGGVYKDQPGNFIIYDGTPGSSWYRTSRIFEREMTEWSTRSMDECHHYANGAFKVNKPLDTTCNCFPTVLYVGRYGAWSKDQLSTDAFQTVHRILS